MSAPNSGVASAFHLQSGSVAGNKNNLNQETSSKRRAKNITMMAGLDMSDGDEAHLEKAITATIKEKDNTRPKVPAQRKPTVTAAPAPPSKISTPDPTTSTPKPTTKPAARAKTPGVEVKRAKIPRAKTPGAPCTPAAQRIDTPFSAPKSLGKSAIARLTEKASNDRSRDLQPIRRPLPAEDREWNSDGSEVDIDHASASSSQASESEDDQPHFSYAKSLTDNPDLSDSDVSKGISEDENGIPRTYNRNAAGPDPQHPYSTSAKYKVMPPRGIVRNADGSTVDFDSAMTFPDAEEIMAAKKKLKIEDAKKQKAEKKVPLNRKEVLMSFSDNIATPEMNWILRKNNALSSNSSSVARSQTRSTGEFLDGGLGVGLGQVRTRGASAGVKFMDGKEKEARGKGRKGIVNGVLKKKVARQPKYQKRPYKWKDASRKNKGRLYDERKMGVEGRGKNDDEDGGDEEGKRDAEESGEGGGEE